MFARWGRFVHHHHWSVLIASLAVLILSFALLPLKGSLSSPGAPETGKAKIANQYVKQVPTDASSSFLLVYSSKDLVSSDRAFQNDLTDSLIKLNNDPRVTKIATPYDSNALPNLISRDGHEALVFVTLKDDVPQSRVYFNQLRNEIHTKDLKVLAGGQVGITSSFDSTLNSDLSRAEAVSAPISLLLLLIVFGSLVAALLPLGVGGMAVVAGIALTGFLAHFTDVSSFALNVVTLIGLGVAIDYSLFIVNRYREERSKGGEIALSNAMKTAGRTIAFSGLTVAIGLSGLLFYSGSFLSSMGISGTLVVAVAVFYSLTFLPALLSILGDRVDKVNIAIALARIKIIPTNGWEKLANFVMNHAVMVLLPCLLVLFVASIPFASLKMSSGGPEMLPTNNEARMSYDKSRNDFVNGKVNRITLVTHYPQTDLNSPQARREGYLLQERILAVPGVLSVRSPYSTPLGMNEEQALIFLANPPLEVRNENKKMMSDHVVLYMVIGKDDATSDKAFKLIENLDKVTPPAGGEIFLTGQTAEIANFNTFVLERSKLAIPYIMIITYIVIFLLTGSILLPLKAVLMNLVSIGASFGALVYIFQMGHFANLFGNFTPAPIDPTVPVLLFCIVFGLSMDYEVLLLSRIQEEWDKGQDNQTAVAKGLEKSARLITGAAAIMMGVFISFGVADVVVIKAIGLSMALAVLIDATIVRALMVPAIMRLLGDANWWAPFFLTRIYSRIGFKEET